MDRFCKTDFWDHNKTWYAENPDFTPCFHETAMVWVPCAFLWLLSPFELFRIRSTAIKANGVPWTFLAKLKLIFAVLLAFLSSLELADTLANTLEKSPAEYFAPIIKIATFSYAALLISLNRKKAIQASGTLFIFWLLMSICSVAAVKSLLSDLHDSNDSSWTLASFVYATKMVAALAVLAELVFCCLPESFGPPARIYRKPSPEWRASFLGQMLFTWFDGLVIKGYKTPIVTDDVFDLSEEFESAPIFDKFSKHWSYPERSNISLPLFKTFWPRLLGASCLKLISSLLVFVSPSVLDYILVWLASDEPYWHGFFYAALMFVAAILMSILNNQYEYMVALSGMQLKTAVVSALHRKSLRLSPSAKSQFTTGQVVNLMSVDSQAIVNYVSAANNWWAAPLQIVIAIYLLWQQLGVATLAGIGMMLLVVPVNGYTTSRMRTTYGALMKEKDKRSKLMTEIIDGMKVLKMYAWETSLCEQVKGIRNSEIFYLKIQAKLLSFTFFTIACTPVFVATLSFLAFTFIDEDNVLDPSKTFVSLALFNILRMPLTVIPFLISSWSSFVVAEKRINAFLGADELKPDDIGRIEDEKAIEIKDGAFSWSGKGEPTLSDIDLKIERKKLVAVVGTVGSGKSSLVSALLGDMEKLKGKVNISGNVAYVPQQAWIQNATVKKNIVFTGSVDQARYEAVIASCALEADLKILEAGDETEIGEKGINLSGGQKQRISLARAVYTNRDIYLLDDPLSAVDSHVGKHIFDQVIGPKGVLKDTTRILVTHKVALLPHVDEIVVMKDGRISEYGSYHELLQRKGAFADFLVEHLVEDNNDDEDLEDIKAMIRPELERRLSKLSDHSGDKAVIRKDSVRNRTKSTISNSANETAEQKQRTMSEIPKKPKRHGGKLMEAESAETGSVKWSVCLDYIRAIGATSCIAILALSIISNGFSVASSLWLAAWSDDGSNPERVNDTQLRYVRLAVYGGLGISQGAVLYVSNLITFYGVLRASSTLHNVMLEHILRAPMSFYDTTPSGRILNRFGKDVDSLDTTIRMSIQMFLIMFFKAAVTFLVICMQTPFFIVPLVPLGIIYYVVQRYSIMTSRQLRRLESNSRSPVYSHFSETVSGTSCIRAFQVEEDFNLACDRKNDINNATNILCLASTRWLSMRLEFLGNVIVLLAALFAIFAKGSIDASTVGLSLSYALTATSTLNMMVANIADLENNLVSVERCFQYTKTPTEAPLTIEATEPKKSWPEHGVIEFRDYAARYRDGLDLVLKDLNFSVKAGEKVGIVGRTGAGKSSLTVALFRIVEPANGTIIIDGVDVTRIGLHNLRAGLTIIPQEPVLFTGTLRLNLDPFRSHDDSELWIALKLAHLQHFVDSLGMGLDFSIAEGGDNLSVGQRQLVCLARALLRKSKILILDEATAAVDLETDDLIQKTIRDQFADCTILTIAHRLNTILDYDKVLVMDKGSVSEYDTPKALLDNNLSAFHSMAKDAGLLASGGQADVPRV